MSAGTDAPRSDIDLWSDEVLRDPYPHFRALRDAGPIVWLSKVNAWGAFRFKAVREILGNSANFSSAKGVMLNDAMNRFHSENGSMICSDSPRHRDLRRVYTRPLTPVAVAALRERLTEVMDAQVRRLLELKAFDAVTQLARLLPLTVVTELVGLSQEGKSNMLHWAAGVFDACGPEHSPRTLKGLEIGKAAFDYVSNVPRESLDPNGWGAALFAAVDRGELQSADARALLGDYVVPSLDTTINALSSAIWLFGKNPDQWTLVREQPALIPNAIDEVVRLESPIRGFSRVAVEDYLIDDVRLSAGDRVQVFYASANRDERRYPEPDRFLVTRGAKDHVGFGYGPHVCGGMHLAKLEVSIALAVLVRHVAKFSINSACRTLHNTLNGLGQLDVTIEPAFAA